MRLIDADKIEYTSIAHLASYPVAPSPCDTVMRAEINAMPTVDAIPVALIKERIDVLHDLAEYEFDAEGGFIGSASYKLWELQDLLKQWEESQLDSTPNCVHYSGHRRDCEE